jgi:hypothetical protein
MNKYIIILVCVILVFIVAFSIHRLSEKFETTEFNQTALDNAMKAVIATIKDTSIPLTIKNMEGQEIDYRIFLRTVINRPISEIEVNSVTLERIFLSPLHEVFNIIIMKDPTNNQYYSKFTDVGGEFYPKKLLTVAVCAYINTNGLSADDKLLEYYFASKQYIKCDSEPKLPAPVSSSSSSSSLVSTSSSISTPSSSSSQSSISTPSSSPISTPSSTSSSTPSSSSSSISTPSSSSTPTIPSLLKELTTCNGSYIGKPYDYIDINVLMKVSNATNIKLQKITFDEILSKPPGEWTTEVAEDIDNFKYLCAHILVNYSLKNSDTDNYIIFFLTYFSEIYECNTCIQPYITKYRTELNNLIGFTDNGYNVTDVRDFKACAYKGDIIKCFTGESLVLMADYTTKKIKDITIDDMVISVKTGLAQKILLVDKPPITTCELYGLNNYEPFATTNHPFISTDNKLLAVDVNSLINISKYDKTMVDKIEINNVLNTFDITNNTIKPITVENITINKHQQIQLYNIITEDHTFFINGFGVFDNIYNFEGHKKEAIKMSILVNLSKDIIKDFTFEDLFNKYYNDIVNMKIDINNYDELFYNTVSLCKQDQLYIDFLNYLWCNKWVEFS